MPEEEDEYVDSVSVTTSVIQVSVKSVCNIPRTQLEVTEDTRNSRLKYAKSVSIGLVIIGLVYFILYLILAHNARSKALEAKDQTRGANLLQNVATCGADSFMLRDSICDEATNTVECRYDGGDCCLEIKDTRMCKNCSCILAIDPDKLQDQFEDLSIKPVRRSVTEDDNFDWTVYVQDVVSGFVCGVLCLDHNEANSINVWHYNNSTLVCKCGWVTSLLCPETAVKENWELRKTSNLLKFSTYIQLGKTVTCDCQARGLLVNGPRTIANQKALEAVDFISTTLWHCQHQCKLDKECVLLSWKWHEQLVGDCRHFSYQTDITINHGWISSSENCNDFSKYFSSGLPNNSVPTLSFGPFIYNHKMEDSLLILTTGIDPEDWNKKLTETQLFAVAENSGSLQMSEVSHSGLDLSMTLQNARGGLLKVNNPNDQVDQETEYDVIICGGEHGQLKLDTCFSLVDQSTTIARYSFERHLPAVAVVADGTALWVAGGSDETKKFDLIQRTIFGNFTLTNDDSLTSHVFSLTHTCLQILESNNYAVLYGGFRNDSNLDQSWMLTTSNNWATVKGEFPKRVGHMCGVLKGFSEYEVVVSAGGKNSQGRIQDSVHLLKVYDGNMMKVYWESGPKLPIKLASAATATTQDRRHMFVAGGETESDDSPSHEEGTRSIFALTCQPNCQWTEHGEVSLFPGRSRSLAFILPPYSKLSGVSIQSLN